VAFGEPVQDYEDAERLVRACRVLLVVGTSGEAYPAAGLPDEARAAGARIIDVTEGGSLTVSDLRLVGAAGSILPALAQAALNRSSGRG
jgi:NAD-dependent deacetylase